MPNVPLTALGGCIPAHSAHAISVSLPTWKDNIGYMEGEPRVAQKILSGYPRFVIHHLIRKLEAYCELELGVTGEKCHLYPSFNIAEQCRLFLLEHSPDKDHPLQVRVASLWIHPSETLKSNGHATPDFPITSSTGKRPSVQLHVVFFPIDSVRLARQFWQHTGTGISSRFAAYCLGLLAHQEFANGGSTNILLSSISPVESISQYHDCASHKKGSAIPTCSSVAMSSHGKFDEGSPEFTTYLDEYFARNPPISEAVDAKQQLRGRIADILSKNPCSGVLDPNQLKSSISENDVIIFPSGMSAIWHAHRAVLRSFIPSKSVCFGFPYTDTLKVLQKWGPGAHFFVDGLDSDLAELEALLKSCAEIGEPIHALYCEYPSNPLLRTPSLVKLRELANRYDFLIVIDETIASFANVDVLPFVDVLASSLSKVFSGSANVLGGSLVLNPEGRHYGKLKTAINELYEDMYWSADAVFMERNSRDFEQRIRQMNKSTRTLAEFLRSRSLAGLTDIPPAANSDKDMVIKTVYYPLWQTRQNYDSCRIGSAEQVARSGRQLADVNDEGGYGMLFTIIFTSQFASETFYEAVQVQKGPSLGTNFTLASPYAILAHYHERDWAAQLGVEQGLVRVSVGLEDEEDLLERFKYALRITEEAVKDGKVNRVE